MAGPLRKINNKKAIFCCYLKIEKMYVRQHIKILILAILAEAKTFNCFVAIFGKKYSSFSATIVGRKKVDKTLFRPLRKMIYFVASLK